MTSIFKGFDPDRARIQKSKDKIAEHPEAIVVRGLLLKENPTIESIDALEQALIELEQQRLDLISKKAELERKKIESEPVVLSFRGSDGYGRIKFEVSKKDSRLKELYTTYNVRAGFWNELDIHIDKFLDFEKEVLEQYPNVKFVNFDPIHEPFWKIKKQDKQIAVQWNPITNGNGTVRRLTREEPDRLKRLVGAPNLSLLSIPGLFKKEKYYTVPFSEGWRLYEIHPELETRLCKWESEELVEEVKAEFEKRLRVKEIHTATDSPVDYDFPDRSDPTFKTRGHQRVAYEFQDLVDHKALIVYGTGTGKTAIGIGGALRAEAKKIVVICPGKLRLNWRNHIRELTGDDPLILAGRAPTKDDFKYLIKHKPRWLIINYEILRTVVKIKKDGDRVESDKFFPWVDLLNLYMPDYIIGDETHYIRNPSSSQSQAFRQLEAPKKDALTATPIMNRPGELWSVLNWLYPEQFPYYDTFLSQYGYGRGISDYDAQQLRSLLETIMIKRSRKDISPNLPPVNRIVETFGMSERAREIYERILFGIYEEMAEYDHLGVGGQQRQFTHILPKLNAMIKVCAADMVSNTVERAMVISDELTEEQWNKIIIFTHFRGTCNTIARSLNLETGLGETALSFVKRTDTGFVTLGMEERMRLVHEFNTNPAIKYLVVTNESADEGLDMTAAGVVMFNDLFWNPAKHIQCEGRAFYRESDMHGGDSYYLQFFDSIMEWIVELQGVKGNTIDKVVEGKGMDHSITSEIMDKLRELFKKRTKGG